MTAPIVVGCAATPAGRDAMALGARLAVATGAPLVLTFVLPADMHAVLPPATRGPEARSQAEAWLMDAAASLPAAVTASTQVRIAESFAQGLVDAAHVAGAGLIVVGAANGGLRGRHRLGTVAAELLHSSDVAVALAPEGSRRVFPAVGVTRITAAIGMRPGADLLMEGAIELSQATGAELRILSLVALDLPAGIEATETAAEHADEVYIHVRAALPPSIKADTVVGLGDSIEDAVRRLRWEPGELAVVGSSRLARGRRLFLGATAAKMLRELPVPMIVAPRTRGSRTLTGTPAELERP
ncbi:MAG: universal stress protein [Microbacterium sp.]|uniref:universal stress protein n=1 Tax=Microbacterium sp. TaxID=51671 RepID=UPI003A83AD8A